MPTIHYQVWPISPAKRLFLVELSFEHHGGSQGLALPKWIPGSYMIREFAKDIVDIEAYRNGEAITIQKMATSEWQINAPAGHISIKTRIYAGDTSVRMAFLDSHRGFFNGTSLFLCLLGREEESCEMTVHPPEDSSLSNWRLATSMRQVAGEKWGFGRFAAKDYDELVDHPVEMGAFELLAFSAGGIPHYVVVSGRQSMDKERFVADLTTICSSFLEFFGEPVPMPQYLFLLNVVGKGYGGLEHRHSTALIATRKDLPTLSEGTEVSDGYLRLLGLCSHEYFHTWNVKRIKPANFLPYDFFVENHTRQLWVFEGVTSYYDDLALVRTGLITPSRYLELLGKTLTRVRRDPGKSVQSLSDSSFDAWIKLYRRNEDSPNTQMSYYAKGSLLALALDLKLRIESSITLDDVMLHLWERYGSLNVGLPEGAFERICSEISGLELDSFFDRYVRGVEDIDLEPLFKKVGVLQHRRSAVSREDNGGKLAKKLLPAGAGDLGARFAKVAGGVKLSTVLHGGAASDAGMSSGDVIVAIDGLKADISGIYQQIASISAGDTVQIHAFRADVLMVFLVTLLPAPKNVYWLELDENASESQLLARAKWLSLE